MTRINLVEPKQLTNKHLLAEYRELPRIFTAVKKLQDNNKQLPEDISSEYILGKGHVKFFYNKLNFLMNRYKDLYNELINRGYNINKDIFKSVINDFKLIDLSNDINYYPKPEEIYLNMIRICKRSNIDKVNNEIKE